MTVVLYRGDIGVAPSGREGECWTADPDVARWYVSEEDGSLRDGGAVYRTEADVADATEVEIDPRDPDAFDAVDSRSRRATVRGRSAWIRYRDCGGPGHDDVTYRVVADVELVVTEVTPVADRCVHCGEHEDDGCAWDCQTWDRPGLGVALPADIG